MDATLSFSNAVAIGLASDDQVYLNPAMDTVIKENDQIILLEIDDGAYEYHRAKRGDSSKICNTASASAKASDNLLVLGSNDKLPIILQEYSKYVEKGTRVVIVDNDFDKTRIDKYENLEITVCTETITRKLLCEFLNSSVNNILLLNDDSNDFEFSDSQTLLRLILLRDIADKHGLRFSITTEMRSVDNQRLASQARVDDFVIGSDFSCLIMAQISENPKILPLIDDILDENGSELYIKPISHYINIGVPVDLYTLAESASLKGEIFLGYQLNKQLVINPQKTNVITFGENDRIVVIAES